MNKYTKEPWRAFDRGGYISIRTAGNDAGTSDNNSWGYADIATMHGTDDEEQKANVRLIAAAPCLLKALQEIEELIKESEGVAGYHLNGEIAQWDSLELTLFDAIERATGEVHETPTPD